jgi:hypothetical protein
MPLLNQTLRQQGRWNRMNDMNNLQQRLMTADRSTLLGMLAQVIHELTIRARYFYDRTDALEGMRETNEAIHHVSGHLRDLIDPIEPMTDSRADGIAAASELLPQRAITRIYEFTA